MENGFHDTIGDELRGDNLDLKAAFMARDKLHLTKSEIERAFVLSPILLCFTMVWSLG